MIAFLVNDDDKNYWNNSQKFIKDLTNLTDYFEIHYMTLFDKEKSLLDFSEGANYFSLLDYFDKIEKNGYFTKKELFNFISNLEDVSKKISHSHIPFYSAYRLLAPFYFQDTFWYFDTDLKLDVKNKNFFNIDIKDYPIALAVEQNKIENSYYIDYNFGVFIMNKNIINTSYKILIEKIVKNKQFLYKMLYDNGSSLVDQTIINKFIKISKSEVLKLPNEYNYTIKEESSKDRIIHYAGVEKPWGIQSQLL